MKMWASVRQAIDLGVRLIKPQSGRYLTHCIGKNATAAIEEFEAMLAEVGDNKCKFSSSESYVKSFCETWAFYQIWRSE